MIRKGDRVWVQSLDGGKGATANRRHRDKPVAIADWLGTVVGRSVVLGRGWWIVRKDGVGARVYTVPEYEITKLPGTQK